MPGGHQAKKGVADGGQPIANSTVTLWAASAGAPTATGADAHRSRWRLHAQFNRRTRKDATLYLIAKGGQPTANAQGGDNPAIALMTVMGSNLPGDGHDQRDDDRGFGVDQRAIPRRRRTSRGLALGLRIAAGNVPNFVDLQTGGWGAAIQDPLNSGQTPTMANFATLADVLAGCVTRVTAGCLRQALRRGHAAEGCRPDRHADGGPVDRAVSVVPARRACSRCSKRSIRSRRARRCGAVPFMPYLSFSPSAWVLPLKFDGGGYRAGGKAMFDSEGNLWVGDNFTVGWQALDTLWQGNATKFAPNGKPLSPITTGFVGGGMQGGTFGAAVDAKDNAWFSSYGGKSIAVFDKNGKPLTPPEGITLNGQLGLMQGIIVAPNGDVWVLGVSKNQLVHFPKGDLTKGRIVCEGRTVEPCKSFLGPFHLAIDQQDRIWVSNGVGDFVTRFSAADPSKVETFKAGYSGSGLNIDSQGNVWVTNRLGSSERGKVALEKFQKIMSHQLRR